MHKPATKVFFGAWAVWLLYQLVRLATSYVWTRPGVGSYEYGMAFGGATTVGLGGWLAWRLYCRPRRSTSIWFAIICVILVWKFCVADILLFMHPALGGYTFSGAVAHWWLRIFSSVRVALASLLPIPLLAVSLTYWPIYCRKRKVETSDHAA
jgi:hypothetical protein